MVDGLTGTQPVQDIFGLGRLADAIRANRLEEQQRAMQQQAQITQGLQQEGLKLGLQQQRMRLADLAHQQRQQQQLTSAIQAGVQAGQPYGFARFNALKQFSPDEALKYQSTILDQAGEIAKIDAAQAAAFANENLGTDFEFVGKTGSKANFQLKSGVGPEGRPVFFQFDPADGSVKALEGFRPAQDQTLQIRREELQARKEDLTRKAGELKPTMQKILDTAQNVAFDSEKTANSLDLLANDFDQLRGRTGGGVGVTISEFLKDTLGTQDDVSVLRRKFRGIRASQSTRNLPPGPASDKDIQLALSGFPPENAPPEVISTFLRGASKLARIDQAFNEFKAQYISQNKNSAGLINAWQEQRSDVINRAMSGFGAQETSERTIVLRHPTLGDVTEADIQETMRSNNMTREQVLERLQGGGQ